MLKSVKAEQTTIVYNDSMTSDNKQRYAALIAAFNEADRVFDTVIATSLVPGVAGVIVANDGSTDKTADEAARAGALVVSNQRNLGKGTALELAATTLQQVQPFGALDGVLLLDADLGQSASAAEDLLLPLKEDTVDLVVGILPSPAQKSGFGLATGLARDGIQQFGKGFESKAPLSGQRALTLDCLGKVRPFAQGYAMEVAMTICALRKNQRVVEVPVSMTHRYFGRNLKGFMHRGRQFYQIYQLLSTYRRR